MGRQPPRLTITFGSTTHSRPLGPLGKVVAAVAGTALLAAAFVFSLVLVAVLAVAGSIGFGYLMWKTRALRAQLRERLKAAQARATPPTEPGTTIIEGDYVRESEPGAGHDRLR